LSRSWCVSRSRQNGSRARRPGKTSVGILLTLLLLTLPSPCNAQNAAAAAKPAFQRRGFYLHGCWTFNYPFAVRTWQRDDYRQMFGLLKRLGFDTVMLWPVLEAVPPPLTDADRDAVRQFRPIIDNARECGLECWLAQCAALTSRPEIRAKPWMQRSLYPAMKTVRLDDPKEADAYFQHRAALLEILNNADGYVTIDGDPGGYPGAKPAEFLQVFLRDRQTIDRAGARPKTQKVIPWIWCGWGTKGVWQEPIGPYVTATLETLKGGMPEPWELLPGRSIREGHANGRINMELTKAAGLLDRSTLLLYEIIEFEPTPPAAVLQFGDIRRVLKEELAQSPGVRGCFGNAQQPIMVLPNLYLFARGAADPAYLDRPDEQVLADLAHLLGGPAEALVPAWSCLQRDLAGLPADLPERLRAARLTGEAASFLPGGAARYLDILARQADSRIRLLRACGQPARTPEEAASAVAAGTAALVDWWKVHRYIGAGQGNEPFQWQFVHSSQYGLLKQWCAKNVSDPKRVLDLAAEELIRRGTLSDAEAAPRGRQLLGL
jgi:hypothetical protein